MKFAKLIMSGGYILYFKKSHFQRIQLHQERYFFIDIIFETSKIRNFEKIRGFEALNFENNFESPKLRKIYSCKFIRSVENIVKKSELMNIYAQSII